jgi:hypothetical protein
MRQSRVVDGERGRLLEAIANTLYSCRVDANYDARNEVSPRGPGVDCCDVASYHDKVTSRQVFVDSESEAVGGVSNFRRELPCSIAAGSGGVTTHFKAPGHGWGTYRDPMLCTCMTGWVGAHRANQHLHHLKVLTFNSTKPSTIVSLRRLHVALSV